jgi:type IX secretion system PorP/SprF family membrane protein
MRISILHIILFVLTLVNSTFAQDPHFTQINKIGSAMNPAAAGYRVEHIRSTLLYRNQWNSVKSPFTTQAFFFDKAVGRTGMGINIENNSAGESGMRQLFLNGNLAYSFQIGKNNLTTGIQLGFIHKSFDPSKMTFDDQYVQDQGFNAGLATAETFSYTKLTRPDLGAGLMWSRNSEGNFKPYASISLLHINQPKETFILDENPFPKKIVANTGAEIYINEHLTLSPVIQYAQQFTLREIMTGMIVKMPMQDRNSVEAGVFYRHQDAIALYAGYQWNNIAAGISYDMNISGSVRGPGAFELTLTYIPKAKEKKEQAPKKEKEKKERSIPSGKITEVKSVVSTPASEKKVVEQKVSEGTREKTSAASKKLEVATPKVDKTSNSDLPIEDAGILKASATSSTSAKLKDEMAGIILFKTNSVEVKGIIRLEVIEPVLDELYEHPEWKLVISGHTDSEGSEEFNNHLSQQRADAIKAIFIRKGLEESRISTAAFGESKPLDDNTSIEGKAANRRAEIHIIRP